MKTERNGHFCCFLCSRGCTRQKLGFDVENCQLIGKKQLTRRLALDLHMGSTHDQPSTCRARPVNVDDVVEGISGSRRQGGEKLPAASWLIVASPGLIQEKTSLLRSSSVVSVAHSLARSLSGSLGPWRPDSLAAPVRSAVACGWWKKPPTPLLNRTSVLRTNSPGLD